VGAVQSSGVEELSSHSGQGGGLVQKKASTYPDPILFMNSALLPSSVANTDPLDPYVLGLLDPDPDLLVRGIDPDLDRPIIKHKL
jgi:hypothetical protein